MSSTDLNLFELNYFHVNIWINKVQMSMFQNQFIVNRDRRGSITEGFDVISQWKKSKLINRVVNDFLY